MFGINFIRRLFNFHFESKPKEAMAKFGVFIRSCKSDGEIIEVCRKLLQEIKSDTKIVAVKRDDTCNGLKVYFNCGSGVEELIKKKFLNRYDETTTIHSLTTVLTIQNAFPTSEKRFLDELRSQIQNLGPVQVLDISKISFSEEYPDIGTGNWRIVLDVPEVEELDVFKTMGLPDNMVLKMPPNGDCFHITFYCRFCKKNGHTQWRCSDILNSEATEIIHPSRPVNLISRNEEDNLQMASTSKVPSGFRIRDLAEKRAECIPKVKAVFPQEDIEAFESEIGKEEAHRYYNSFPLGNDIIKKEKHDPIATQCTSSMKRSSNSGIGNETREVPAKKHRNVSTNENRNLYSKEFSGESNTRASSTTVEDAVEIIYVGSSKYPPDDSPVVTTSNQPEAPSIFKSELPSTDNDSDSNQPPLPVSRDPVVKRRKKTPQILPIVIPNGIKEIIDKINGVLSAKQLEAFFNHVKKKSCPAKFAKLYTPDVEGLKKQLNTISQHYYLTPKVGTNTDIKFMKMLGNVLGRFDGTLEYIHQFFWYEDNGMSYPLPCIAALKRTK